MKHHGRGHVMQVDVVSTFQKYVSANDLHRHSRPKDIPHSKPVCLCGRFVHITYFSQILNAALCGKTATWLLSGLKSNARHASFSSEVFNEDIMLSSAPNRPVIRAYIASEKINSTISAYGICVPVGEKKIIALGTVPGNQMPYAQMVALDNFLSAVDDAGLSECTLEAILWRDALRQRLENTRSRKMLVEIGQSVRELIEDPDRWDEVAMRAAKVVFGFPTEDEERAELTFIRKQLVGTYIFRSSLGDGPLIPTETRLSLDTSNAVPLPHNSEYLLSDGSFGKS